MLHTNESNADAQACEICNSKHMSNSSFMRKPKLINVLPSWEENYGIKGRLNTDPSLQNFWTTLKENDLTEKLKKSAVANAIAIPLPLCFSCFVLLRRFRKNLTNPFYFYLFRTRGSPGVTPSVVSLALRIKKSIKKLCEIKKRFMKNVTFHFP